MKSKREKKQGKGRESGLQDGHARFGRTRVVDAVEKSLMVEKVESADLEKEVELRGDFWEHVKCFLAEEQVGNLRGV